MLEKPLSVVEVWGLILSAITVFKTFEYLINRFIFPKFQKDVEDKQMKETIQEIKSKLDKDFEVLNRHEERLDALENKINESDHERSNMREALRIIVYGQQQITKSLLEDGNNKKGLQEAESKLDEYLRLKM